MVEPVFPPQIAKLPAIVELSLKLCGKITFNLTRSKA
jgi:hypothetical protein